MPKGYWIAHVTVDDAEGYEAYRRANAVPFARHGARFLVRGGAQEVVEGAARPRSVVIEFPTLAAARACWDDPDYIAARALRGAVSQADVVCACWCRPHRMLCNCKSASETWKTISGGGKP